MSMKAYVLIKIRAGEVKEVVRQLRKIDTVLEANMTFGPYDAVAVIEGRDISAIGNLIASAIQPVPGVEQTLTCLAVDI
jgi:DNA-binding Lrp family transcriptional regulator